MPAKWPEEDRVAEEVDAVRRLLERGDGRRAVNAALHTLQIASSYVRRCRPDDGSLWDAEVAGAALALAIRLHRYQPRALAQVRGRVGREHLLATLDAALADVGNYTQGRSR
jgi:hypothetical protein